MKYNTIIVKPKVFIEESASDEKGYRSTIRANKDFTEMSTLIHRCKHMIADSFMQKGYKLNYIEINISIDEKW